MQKILHLSLFSILLMTTTSNIIKAADPVTDQTRENWASQEWDRIFARGSQSKPRQDQLDNAKAAHVLAFTYRKCVGSRNAAQKCVNERVRIKATEFLVAEAKETAKHVIGKARNPNFINEEAVLQAIENAYTDYAITQLSDEKTLAIMYANLKQEVESSIKKALVIS